MIVAVKLLILLAVALLCASAGVWLRQGPPPPCGGGRVRKFPL